MQKLTGDPEWLNPMPGLSPIEGVARLDLKKKIHLFVGEQDVVAPPMLTTEFYDSVKALGGEVSMQIIPGSDHETVLRKERLAEIFKNILPK